MVWSINATEAQRQFPIKEISTFTWSADGQKLLLMDPSLTVSSCDVVTGERRAILDGIEQTRLVKAEWDPAGRYLAATYTDGGVRVWPMDGKEKPVVLKGDSTEVTTLCWTSDGKRLATATRDGKVRVYTTTGEEVFSAIAKEKSQAFGGLWLAWAPDNRRLVGAPINFFSAHIRIWDTITGKEIQAIDSGPQTIVGGLIWSTDGKWLATHQSYGPIQVWDAETGRQVLDLKMSAGASIDSLLWSLDSKRLVFRDQGVPKIVEVESKKELVSVKKELLNPLYPGLMNSLTLSPDGKQFAMATPGTRDEDSAESPGCPGAPTASKSAVQTH